MSHGTGLALTLAEKEETRRKVVLLSTALAFGNASIGNAGGMPEPVMEPEVVEQAISSSADGLLLPALLLREIAVAASCGSNESSGQLSDIRLKEGLVRVGTNYLGLPLYQFRYKELDGVWEGLMAQDVEILRPDTIRPLPDGFKAVD